MTEEKTFQPITTQEEFDQRIKSRLAREREKWEKESGVPELQAKLEAKDEEILSIKAQHFQENARRAVLDEVLRRGVDDEGRVQRVMKLVSLEDIEADAEGKPSRGHVLAQVDAIAADVPELVKPRGSGSRGSDAPVIDQEKPLTREQIESMSVEEQRQPGMKERIDRFLRGERRKEGYGGVVDLR